MSISTLCDRIDDCTMEIIKENKTIVIAIQDGFIYVINPEFPLEFSPLITYVAKGGLSDYNRIIGEICSSISCDSLFTDDIKKHLKNGYPVMNDRKALRSVVNNAADTYTTYTSWKDKQKAEPSKECEKGSMDFL